jgi:hypothetical protein
MIFSKTSGLAIVFAEDTATIANSTQPSESTHVWNRTSHTDNLAAEWADLCPTYDALDSSDL